MAAPLSLKQRSGPRSGHLSDTACQTLATEASAVPQARAFTDTYLAAWRIDGDAADMVRLVVSEFVTNSVCHSGAPEVTLRLVRCRSQVRVEVIDNGAWRDPDPRGPDDGIAEGGRGLALVRALARRHGVHRTPVGTCVWALLR
ncbi:ATP-binding protein [Streptomyces sp. NBC_00038]|uniref:ATP-binding protein n=1 Tax=Streptomyces sp. NBC_00038 TaxID=2903615 RepID=UPI00225051C8|nr:ATP-binding protein [Streptomyces sp. NBC_00038]MCX5562996.1 ATP-binding protein [Streptomyces sp. NBC_00038]